METHFYRAVQLALNVRDGAPFLLWGPDFLRGYGYPIFAFYAPLFYWLITGLHGLGFSFSGAMQLASWLVLPLGGWGVYTLARRYLDERSAVVAGLAYLFAPYLIYDVAQRGALPEAWGLALLPWALVAWEQAQMRRNGRSLALASVVFALLILFHNVIPNIGFAIILALSLVPLAAHGVDTLLNRFRVTIPTILLALGLSAFFWLPALLELDYTQSARPETSPFAPWPLFLQHFTPPAGLVRWPVEPADPALLNPPLSISLGVAQGALALLGVLLLAARWRQIKRRWQWLMWGGITAVSLFLATYHSLPLWQHLPLPQFVQLPTRFFGLASLGAALLAGLAVEQLAALWPQRGWAWTVVGVSSIIVAVSGWPWLYPQYCPLPEEPLRPTLAGRTGWTYTDDGLYVTRWGGAASGETAPRWLETLPPPDALMPQYTTPEPVNRLALPQDVSLLTWQTAPGWERYELVVDEPVEVVYRTFYFPGWRVTLNGRSHPIRVTAEEGLMALQLPPGRHTLEIAFRRTPLRMAALLISGLVGLLVAVMVVRGGTANQDGRSRKPADGHFAYPFLLVLLMLLLGLKFGVVDRVNTPVRAERLQNGRLTGISHPQQINFSGEFTFLGYDGPTAVAPGETFRLTHYWAPQQEIGAPYRFGIRLTDERGVVWNRPPQEPYDFTQYPGTYGWQVGGYVRADDEIRLLPGAPPGDYWVEVEAFRRDVDVSLLPQGAPTGARPSWARVGRIRVTAPGRLAEPEALAVETAAVDVYRPTPLGNLTLLGWSLPEITLRSGDAAAISLLWRGPTTPAMVDPSLVLFLQDGEGAVVAKRPFAVDRRFSLDRWPVHALIRNQLRWPVPPDLATGGYTVWVGNSEPVVRLGTLAVAAPERRFTAPDMARETDIQFDFARLAGFTVSPEPVVAGETLSLDLLWQAVAETETRYRIFVHFRDQTGQIVAQSDSEPNGWTRPTTGWLSPEYILDGHTLSLPPNLPPGAYDLLVGLYNPATGERVGEATLTTVVVDD